MTQAERTPNLLGVAKSQCTECGTDIAPGLLVCPGCARLVHAEDLSSLAAEAEACESRGDRTGALALWRRALALLPPDTRQAAVLQARMRALSQAIDGREESRAKADNPASRKTGNGRKA